MNKDKAKRYRTIKSSLDKAKAFCHKEKEDIIVEEYHFKKCVFYRVLGNLYNVGYQPITEFLLEKGENTNIWENKRVIKYLETKEKNRNMKYSIDEEVEEDMLYIWKWCGGNENECWLERAKYFNSLWREIADNGFATVGTAKMGKKEYNRLRNRFLN